ncbi:hypothetical protein [Gelidibacter pelagius]|uniref:Uncharacterized protein n=1 Tax=Gelidibacter pelagius TaxID=2819985 RepID=A0ABS3STF5_9FLAO|nr:hypothetical protein [Gelidibacter pelagius]MBO3098984.1 hypothetical protein [Gelidibacter pelagius]
MKRIFICLSIATFSIMGMSAQEDFNLKKINSEENQRNLRVYQQQQEQELKTTIREQTEQYIRDAARRMEAEKIEVQSKLEARRAELTHRPVGMVPYAGPTIDF